MNLVDTVIDEIALEGLDGITLEALWDRVALRFHDNIPLPQRLMEQIWNICVQVRVLSFYELQKARDKLVIFDRYEFVDPDLGLIVESDNAPNDIYEHSPIDDGKNAVKGSCATYHTRKDISDTVKWLNVREAENIYGRKLIIVASQATRQNALMDRTVCPNLDMTVMQYCFLERVGRSRYHGEVTQGKFSLSLLGEDPRSLFYHRKFLLRHKLVTKQMHHQKSGGHSCSGSLLHLPRFYVERKPKVIFLAERVIDILKLRENQVAEYSEIKKQLKIENSIKKLFKTSFFQKVVKTDLKVPWRMLYPHAKDKEWQCKNSSKEKMLRVVQLIDPDVDINDMWRDEIIEDDEPFELDTSQQQYAMPFLRQANRIVEKSKHDGLGQTELAQKMGLPKLQSRTFFRNLAKSNIVATYMNDMGRQRVTKYVSRKFEDGSRMSKQFKHEMYKMKTLTKPRVDDIQQVDNVESFQKSLTSHKNVENKKNINEKLSTDERTENERIFTKIPSNVVDMRDSSSFVAATRILRKYKLTGYRRTYRRTFCNVSDLVNKIIKTRRHSFIRFMKQNVNLQSKSESTPETLSNISLAEINRNSSSHASDISQKLTNNIVGMKDLTKRDMKNVSTVTYRLLKRANMIIEAVKEHRVIDDMRKLIKVISEEEEREGYHVRIDKKSLLRLLQRLAKDNLLKNIKLTLSTNKKEKCLTFICDPSIDINHTIIRSAVEQAKIKFCLIGAQKVKTVLQSNTEKLELPTEISDVKSIDKLHGNKDGKKISPSDLVYDTKAGRRYGYAPKFIRMQTLHAYLFYIIYEHPGNQRESQEKLIQLIRSKGVSIDENLEKEMSPIFNTEVGWKMFVPPLPKHNGWPIGWALMCDLLLRMPLSIFLKIHKVSYRISDFENYTNHPVRKHLLVKDMPTAMRNILLIRRKYIFSIHDTITRLCYIGLLQFGPHKLKEKDKVFVFLNRNTELLDTRSSAAHYHKIEEKIYPSLKYKFTSLQTIDKYWYKLWTICVNTRLGGRLVVQGKDIVLEDLTKKNDMIKATEPRSPEESPILDSGHVPGDRLGAAGIDSAFFAYLKRNWSWESSNYPFQRLTAQFDPGETNLEGERDSYMSRVKSKPVKFTEFHGLKKINGPFMVDAMDLKKLKSKNLPDSINSVRKQKHDRVSSTRTSKQRSYVRRVLPRRTQNRARVKYDEIDYSALQRMDKLRVDWDTREDYILLVCKVAMMYLCPNPRKQIISFTSVRDVLRSYSLISYNKTSRACQRRLLYMLKQPETHHSVTLGVEELNQNFYINRRYRDIVDKLKREYRNSQKYDEHVTMIFRDLVAHIAKKHYDLSDLRTTSLKYRLKTVEEFQLFYHIKYPMRPSSIKTYHDDTTNDIHSSTINSVIHSSMCCVKDRRSWAYQLFRIYQQYPEWLLRSAMAKIRTDQMVSIKKNYAFAMRKQSNACMPMSSSQYQLSSSYVQKFNTKLPFSVFKEAWEFFKKLASHYRENGFDIRMKDEKKVLGIESMPVNGGTIAAIHDYINVDRLDFDLEIPRHIIMLDPIGQKDDERYIRIARRYQDILRNLEHVNVDDILDGGNKNHKNLFPITTTNIESSESENIVNEKSSSKDFLRLKGSNNGGNDRDPKRISLIRKHHDDNEEGNGNYDSDVYESENETNFDDDDDCFDEIDNYDQNNDALMSFLDDSTIRLTHEDIVKSGFEINIKHTGSLIMENNKIDGIAWLNKNENNSSRKLQGTKNIFAENEINLKLENVDSTMEMGSSGRRDNSYLPEEAPFGDVRVNEIIDRANYARDDRASYHRLSDSNDMQKRFTRIALLQMREELNDLTSNDNHHAHEYFVLNMFKIFYSFSRTKIVRPLELSKIHDIHLPSELIPITPDAYNPLMNDLRKFAIFPKTTAFYERFRQDLKRTNVFKRGMDAIYEFVEERREVGASLLQLSTKFYSILGNGLYEILLVLKENRLVLRSGVKNTRYIHQKYADPWLIHSYKIMRLQKECQQYLPPGCLYVISNSKTDSSKESNEHMDIVDENENDNEKLLKRSDIVGGNDTMHSTNENVNKEDKENTTFLNDCQTGQSGQNKMQKSRTCLLQTKDIYRAARQLDLDSAEEIRVVVRPWIRIDGALNQRVLDRMLGGVLAYALVHPGVHLIKIQEKFAPAIQPFHTKELVEILMRLGCLKMGIARKSRVTLFSNSPSTRPVFSYVPEAPEWSDDELFVDSTLEATLRFSLFLSNRTYTTDFLS